MPKVDLITGFLGAGKTTFLLKYARFLMKQGLRIGIMEYDYSAVNVDMLLLNRLRSEQCELEMIDAACDEDSLRRRFRTKLIAMAMSGYDRILIEPSGVFDMDVFFDTLRDDPLDQWLEIGSVITVVNANLREEQTPEADFFLASQAAGAGCILLSRTQLSDEEQISRTKEHLTRAAGAIGCRGLQGTVLAKDWDDLDDSDFRRIMNAGYHVNDYVKVTAGHASSFSSLCFLSIPSDLEELKRKIAVLLDPAGEPVYGKILRVKGFLREGGSSWQINATRYETVTEPASIGQDAVIVIGADLKGDAIRQLIEN